MISGCFLPRGGRLTTGNNVVVRDQGGVLLTGGSDVGGTLSGGQLNLTALDGVGSDVEALVEGDVLAIRSSSDGAGGSIVGQRGEGGEGQGRVGGGARGDEASGRGVDDVEANGGVVRTGPTLVLVDGGRQPSLVSGFSG